MPFCLVLAAALAAAASRPLPVPSAPAVLEPPVVGEAAPDFAYQDVALRWTSFHQMLDRGAVMLVFSPDSATLAGLEARRAELAARGIAPVAVVDRRDTDAWRTAVGLGLHYSVLSDPRGDVAAAFGRWDGTHACPGWCIVDRGARVVARGDDARSANALAATAEEAVPPPSPAAAD